MTLCAVTTMTQERMAISTGRNDYFDKKLSTAASGF